MTYLSLAWQVPAIFTAVPMVHRLLPFRLAARAIPLFYVIVSVLTMLLPTQVCLAMGAAGLVSWVHARMGLGLSDDPGPDMNETIGKLMTWWESVVTYLQTLPWSRVRPAPKDASPEDGDTEDDILPFQEPPRPVTRRIPPL